MKRVTGRVCAICGKRRSGPKGSTMGAAMELRHLGIAGDKVHSDCLRAASLKKAAETRAALTASGSDGND